MSTALVPLETLGKEIVARVEKGRQYQDKAAEMFVSAGEMLVELRDRANKDKLKGGFKVAIAKYCKGLSRSRAYEILAVADGTKTIGQVRSERATRERNRHTVSTMVDTVSSEPNDDAAETGETVATHSPALPPKLPRIDLKNPDFLKVAETIIASVGDAKYVRRLARSMLSEIGDEATLKDGEKWEKWDEGAKATAADITPFDLRNDAIDTLAPNIIVYINDAARTRELANELLVLLDNQKKFRNRTSPRTPT